jgi:phosphinothricin acetyltransferase
VDYRLVPARFIDYRRLSMKIRPMQSGDAAAVLGIYRSGIETGNATFETEVPTWDRFHAGHLLAHRLVAESQEGVVVGWTMVSAVSSRCAYAGVVEHSVYVDPAHWAKGIGRRLLEALISSTEDERIWTIQSGIFPENEASLALHQRVGFRVVGIRERIGQYKGRWRDVVMIERRSPRIW